MKSIGNIVVDLTPVISGGDNGGAKIFVLHLLVNLAKNNPKTNFILLTQFSSNEELAFLDRFNMYRHVIIDESAAYLKNSTLKKYFLFLLMRLPSRVHKVAVHFVYKLVYAIRRKKANSLLTKLGADMLFCPFTAPTYAEEGIPTVCIIYDLQFKTYPQFFSLLEVENRDKSFREACLYANKLVAISDYSLKSAIKYGNLNTNKISTINLRMSQRFVEVDCRSTEIVAQLNLKPSRYLIYPANFWKHKNHEMLLVAFNIAVFGKIDLDIKLLCTGAPSPRQFLLKQAAAAMGLQDRIVFSDYVSNNDLAILLDNSMGMIFPSLYEGFGMPVLEAMAAGIPVACSNLASLPEVVADAAILFDPRIPFQISEAICTLVEDEDMRRRLIVAGRKRAEIFSDTNRMARDYWQVFLSATNRAV